MSVFTKRPGDQVVRTDECFYQTGDQVVRTDECYYQTGDQAVRTDANIFERMTQVVRTDAIFLANGFQTVCKRKAVSVRFPVKGHI